MLLDNHSIELNLEAEPELMQQVIREFKLWDSRELNTEYIKIIRKLAFILSDAIEQDISIKEEPYILKILQLIKQTHDGLVQNMFENKDIIKHLLAFSILVARDLYIFGIQEEAGALSTVLVRNLTHYKGDVKLDE